MKTLFKTLGVFGLFFFLLGNVGWSTTIFKIRTTPPTLNNLNWNSNAFWTISTNSGSTWTSTTNYPTDSNCDSVIINSGKNVYVSENVTVSRINVLGTITVNDGKTFTISNSVWDVDCTVKGYLTNFGTVQVNEGAVLEFTSSGAYLHKFSTTPGTIPKATWDYNSTCQIDSYTSNTTAPSGLGQSFSNFIWDCPSQLNDINLLSGLQTVNNNLTISCTNSKTLYLSLEDALTLTVGNNFTIGATGKVAVVDFSNGSSAIKADVLNIANLFETKTGCTFWSSNTVNVMTINFTSSNARILLSDPASGIWNSNIVVTSSGNLTLSSNFYMYDGYSFTVLGTLDCDKYQITNVPDNSITSFVLGDYGTIKTQDIDGLSAVGTDLGSILTGSRTYSSLANYEFSHYVNTTLQMTGNGVPSNIRNLSINTGSGGVQLTNDLIVNGYTYLTQGSLIIGSKSLTLNGEIENTNGVINGDGTSSSLTIGGGSSPLLATLGRTISPLDINVYRFTLNRNSGLTLNEGTNLTINNSLSLTSGLLTTGTNTVTLGTTSAAGTLTSRASGSNGNIFGKFKRYLQDGVSSYDYYVGPTAVRHLDANLTFTNSPTLTGKYITTEWIPNITVYGPGTIYDPSTSNKPINSCSIAGAWEFTKDPTLSGFIYNMNLRACNVSNYFGTLSTDAAKYKEIRIIRRENGTSVFDLNIPGEHADAEYTSGLCAYNAKRNNLSSFSQYTIGGASADGNSGNGPLPVTLQSLISNVNGKNIQLSWKTSTEVNNTGFDVERKTIDGNWSKVGFVAGNGTRNTPTNYSYTDRNLNTGKYNYRLKQIDNNGNFEYHNLSGTVEVGVPKNYDLSQNYPNPFNPTTKIDFSLPFDSKVNLIIYDLTGREVKTLVNESRQAGYHTVDLNASMLSSGTYFFRIIANANGKDFISTKKMVLVK